MKGLILAGFGAMAIILLAVYICLPQMFSCVSLTYGIAMVVFAFTYFVIKILRRKIYEK